LNELLGFVPAEREITIGDYEREIEVEMHDRTRIVLKKLDPDYDPTNKSGAFQVLEDARQNQQFITGLIYVNEEERPNLLELLELTDEPLATLPESRVRPSPEALQALMQTL
jgi:2-oxoglutarate ferredoxin oxidoreductase subunit beta